MADTIGTRFGDGGRYWTKEEDEYLIRRRAEGASWKMIGIEIGRCKGSVCSRKRVIENRIGKTLDGAGRWTDAEIATLERLYHEWKSCEQIARELGKSASTTKRKIADLTKRGLMKKRARTFDHSARLARINSIIVRTAARAKAEESFGVEFYDRKPAPHMAGLPLDRLTPSMCRYAVNDPDRGEEHLFCAEETGPKSSYCAQHHGIVWTKWRPSL